MDLSFTPEQQELRGVLRRFFTERSPLPVVRALSESDTGFDPVLWKPLAADLGIAGLAVPERFGGSGYTWRELGIAFEEAGRALACVPLLGSVGFATSLILASADDDACDRYLPAMAAGEQVASVALAEESGRWSCADLTTIGERTAGGWRVSGTKHYVLDGYIADLLLVVAATPAGPTIFAVDPGAADTSPVSPLDRTRRFATVALDGAHATPVGRVGEAGEAVRAALRFAAVALSCEQAGLAAATLDMAVGYARTRVQFGRPIGSYQAIKHRCADLLVALEGARSLAYFAAWTAAEDPDQLAVPAHMAAAYCAEISLRAAAENIQIHGGIGFTWEHPAHLYFRRARSAEPLFGDPHTHRAELATALQI